MSDIKATVFGVAEESVRNGQKATQEAVDTCQRIGTLTANVVGSNSWEGDDAEAYRNSVDKLTNSISEQLESINAFLAAIERKIQEDYEERDRALSEAQNLYY